MTSKLVESNVWRMLECNSSGTALLATGVKKTAAESRTVPEATAVTGVKKTAAKSRTA